MDCASMNSTITILDTDDEANGLDNSQDAITDTCDNGANNNTVNNKEDLSLNDVAKQENPVIEKNVTSLDRTCTEVHDRKHESQPLFKVMFRDEEIARQYGEQVREFLERLVRSKPTQNHSSNTSDIILEIWEDKKSPEKPCTDLKRKSSDNVTNDSLFVIDTDPKITDSLDVPTYGKKYGQISEEMDAGKKENPKEDCAPKLECFNCAGNHNLRDCPVPRNQANINKNRKGFNAKIYNRGVRYHLDEDQKFGRMVPGQLSKNLRKALGLNDNQLPTHIYRMRTLGYPPGWLEEARLQHSGLTLFNSDGVAECDPNDEPGEITVEGDKDKYDITKIVEFPGFNVPVPPGIHDELQQWWTPYQQACCSKETMLLMLEGKKAKEGYQRKKLRLSGNASTSDAITTPSEMDVEDTDDSNPVVETVPVNGLFIPPLPKDSPMKLSDALLPPPPPPPGLMAIFDDAQLQPQDGQSLDSTKAHFQDGSTLSPSPSSRTNSPSLMELENLKKRLLVELEDSSSQSNSDTPMKNNSINTSTKTKNESVPESNTSLNSSLNNSSLGSIKTVDLGTPILQSTSPYNKLPSSEKFSKNICDVINFENLPNSTGKYEQMVGVLRKVRDKLGQILKE